METFKNSHAQGYLFASEANFPLPPQLRKQKFFLRAGRKERDQGFELYVGPRETLSQSGRGNF